MSSGAVHALQRFLRLFRAEARCVGDHHLGQPDDGVERRAQLMAHAGDELRLVLARHLQLAALVLDLREQARVLDRQHRLGCERLQEMNGTLGKFARLLAPDHKRADDLVCADQWHNEARSITGLHRDLSQRTWRLVTYIGGLLRLFVLGRLADRIGRAEVLVLDRRNQLFAKAKGGAQPE